MTIVMGLLAAMPLGAQVRTVDPNTAGSLAPPPGRAPAALPDDPDGPAPVLSRSEPPPIEAQPSQHTPDAAAQPAGTSTPPPATDAERAARASATNTYREQDVLTAADGVFGKGTVGLAKLVQRILRDQGQPTAYVTGHEGSGAFIVGLRYGSGTLFHKVEGQREVHWTGPSLGLDVGGSASKMFVLVYNLYDTQELYHRFPAAEGNVYVVGGFTASYLRRGDVVLIPIRLGVGWRLGANVGYMNFTDKLRLLPF